MLNIELKIRCMLFCTIQWNISLIGVTYVIGPSSSYCFRTAFLTLFACSGELELYVLKPRINTMNCVKFNLYWIIHLHENYLNNIYLSYTTYLQRKNRTWSQIHTNITIIAEMGKQYCIHEANVTGDVIFFSWKTLKIIIIWS